MLRIKVAVVCWSLFSISELFSIIVVTFTRLKILSFSSLLAFVNESDIYCSP